MDFDNLRHRFFALVCKLGAENRHEIYGRLIFQGSPQFTYITPITMYLLIEIRQNICINCHGNYIEVNKFNYVLKDDIFRSYSQKSVLKSDFCGGVCQLKNARTILHGPSLSEVFCSLEMETAWH